MVVAPTVHAQNSAAALDALNARIVQAYRDHDPVAYGKLYTDSAVFEWSGMTMRGRDAMVQMARDNWAQLKAMDLKLIVSERALAGDRATEFGAFEQSWAGDSGRRNIEYGRYVELLARQPNGEWRIQRFLGFEDSTRVR
ncbi:MAG TPA: nuclear transport factor 2 family protein [Gemmatimonadaceae bacterium]|nr:nuclear transport factor 2 family protein [Gemmatimonadaceae bacterium]